jgi:hypothetical protein
MRSLPYKLSKIILFLKKEALGSTNKVVGKIDLKWHFYCKP